MNTNPDQPTTDEIFKALADATRRRLLDSLNERNGQNLTDLCSGLDMSRQSVTRHLEVLEAADLVVTMRRGRERLHYLNAAPIHDIANRWIDQYHQGRVRALADLKGTLEMNPMNTDTSTRSFAYTTYIKTTPEQLWRGLTSPEFTKRYWGIELETDWNTGSPMIWRHGDVTIVDPEQVVIEADPYRRLSYAWHDFTPELGRKYGIADDVVAKISTERRSKATFEIDDLGGLVRLTVVHDDFEPDSTMAEMVSEGWPRVLAALKTLLETGDVLEPLT